VAGYEEKRLKMQSIYKTLRAGLIGGAAFAAMTGAAFAADLGASNNTGMKDDVVESARKLGITFNVAGTTDYVFRGISQSREHGAVQGGVDMTYGILYAGVWASSIDFGGTRGGYKGDDAEVDIYAGIKPVLGGINFDLGVIGYLYPGTKVIGSSVDVDYLELKAGASKTVLKDLTLGATVFFSPEGTGGIGNVWTVEGTASKPIAKIRDIELVAGATVGHVAIEDDFNTDYTYWNLGLTANWSKLSFDVRYWDTDLSNNELPAGTHAFQADSRVVGTVKVTLP
jgi:uncharacterized protein (TIGR02001 family)